MTMLPSMPPGVSSPWVWRLGVGLTYFGVAVTVLGVALSVAAGVVFWLG